jgi:hypothetical protein
MAETPLDLYNFTNLPLKGQSYDTLRFFLGWVDRWKPWKVPLLVKKKIPCLLRLYIQVFPFDVVNVKRSPENKV